jgi:cobalt transporter subunit CbtB
MHRLEQTQTSPRSEIDILNPILQFGFFILALGIIYMVGIEPKEMIHNAFHDVRHTAVFPCH